MNSYRLKKFKESIFLVGFMATGKSSIGKILAQELERPFIDLDEYIVEKESMSISTMFNEYGEEYFREKEWFYLLELTQNFKGIISLGGGALHSQQVVDHLKLYGLLVFLKTPLNVILERVSRNKKRPMVLNGEGEIKSRDVLFSEMESLYLQRVDLYNQAQVILESTGEESKDEQAARLIDKLQRYV